MDNNTTRGFDDFWRVITRNESHVQLYGHTRDDYWEERDADDLRLAYAEIEPLLTPISCPRMIYNLPGGLNPFEAKNHHHALILFMGPPERWFGNIGVLDSPAYHTLKRNVEAEQSTIEELTSTKSPKSESDNLNQTASDILQVMDDTPRTWALIAQRSGYEPTTVRKYSSYFQEAGLIRKTGRGFIRITDFSPDAAQRG